MTNSRSAQYLGNQAKIPVKLTPPEPGQYFVRPGLVHKLADLAGAQGKVWISSPGGAGKTSLVRNFLASDSRPLIWYQVDSEDHDPANLFFYLARAVEGMGADERPLPQFVPEYLPNLAIFCRNFCRALFDKIEKGCVLVFDDLQDGPGEALFGPFLAAVMAELPRNSTLLILSRGEPYQLFAKDRLNRSLAHLGWDDLRLTTEETRGFLTWSFDEAPLSKTLDRAYELTRGWLAGLLLFLEYPAEGERPKTISLDRTDLLFDYFAGEIFARLPTTTRDFLYACSVLHSIEVSTAVSLTMRTDAGAILRSLVRENHFTCRISSSPESYRFHPLFRQFLLSRAEMEFDPGQLAEIRQQAANLILRNGQVEPAAELLIDACAWHRLVALIMDQADTLLRQGRSQTLLQWLDALPARLRNDNPWLCYWRGSCLLATHTADARLELTRAFEIFESEDDATGSMLAWGMVVNAIIVGWDDYAELDQWIERFDRLLERYTDYPSPEIEALMVQGICKSLTWRQPDRPDLPDWAARLYQLVTTSRDSTFRLLAGSNLTFYYIMSGQIATANSMVNSLNTDLHSTAVSPLKKLIWLATRAVLEWVMLDRAGCLATIQAGRAIIEESGVHVIDLRLYGQGITLGLTTGDLQLVQHLLDELPMVPIITALDQAHYMLLQADYSLLQGDTAKAIALAEMAVRHADEGGSPVIKALSLAGLILALYQDGQFERAAEVLEQGMILCRGLHWFRSYLHLLAAYFALEKLDEGRARQLLREGFGMAARQGCLNFYPWRDEIMARLCCEAVIAGIEVDYVTRLAACHKLDITQPDLPSLTPKESETLRWVQEGKTTWEIARILAVSEATVKFHVGNILRKLGASSRPQAVAIAMKSGLLKGSHED
jgi:LuxR family transcriptional regulator, maltose regulon positive regulatory protein